MQQDHRRAVGPDAHAQPHAVVNIEPAQRETLDHVPILTPEPPD